MEYIGPMHVDRARPLRSEKRKVLCALYVCCHHVLQTLELLYHHHKNLSCRKEQQPTPALARTW